MVMQSLHLDRVPKTIAKEWFDRGKNEDTLFKFVSYWIVFNQLYNFGVSNIDNTTERERINKYCRNHIRVLKQKLDFTKLDLTEFYAGPVIQGSGTVNDVETNDSIIVIKEKILKKLSGFSLANRSNNIENIRELENKAKDIARDYINIRDNNGNDKIMSLFSEIYTVRCNLFHGSKTPTPSRDYFLVEESNAVLEMCLEDLMDDTFKDY